MDEQLHNILAQLSSDIGSFLADLKETIRPVKRKGRCSDCIWWKDNHGWNTTRRGYCRVHSPVFARNEDGYDEESWPFTTRGDFCGEFQAKEDDDDER